MNDEQQLTYQLGITNVPSDATCDDNGLAECIGMVYDDGEHRVIQKPADKIVNNAALTINGTLLFVHKIPGGNIENYIYSNGTNIISGTQQTICAGGAKTKVTAIGKTLIMNIDGTSNYAIWKNGAYLYLGDMLPEMEMKFSMTEAKAWKKDSGDSYPSTFEYGTKTVDLYSHDDDGVINSHRHHTLNATTYWLTEIKKQEQFNEVIAGIVSAHLKDIRKAKRFCFPFWVRYAVRLYDGSHTCISNPILMMPTVHYNRRVYFSANDMSYLPANHDSEIWPATYDPYSAKLKYQTIIPSGSQWTDFKDKWGDVIKGVDVFVSEEVMSFDINANWRLINPFATERATTLLKESIDTNDGSASTVAIDATNESATDINPGFTTYIMPQQWSEDEFKKRLIETSRFYKLIEIDLDKIDGNEHDTANENPGTNDVTIDSMTLANLTTQTQLEHDDYFSHTNMAANVMKVYNSRLHLADINRSFFDGFRHFSNAIKSSTTVIYDIYVYINTDDGERVVYKSVSSTKEDFRCWFYYPDPRAYKAEVYLRDGSSKYYSFTLKEHPALNGAYAFIGLPYSGALTTGNAYSNFPTVENQTEHIVNRVFVSEVNNPWLFTSKGDVAVGNAEIIGLATQTMALGQEEHGTHPLTVFTKDGLYGLELDKSTGIYIASDVFSREVCNNTKSITETDGAVFFSSAKGLMVVVGNKVNCMSEQLDGYVESEQEPFTDFMGNAFIAYDYRDSLLWIFDGNSTTCWIYSIKSGAFAHYNFGTGNVVSNVVNDYPDYLLQIGSNIYSLTDRPNINKDGTGNPLVLNTYAASMVTRAMKFGNGMVLKSVMRMRHVLNLHGQTGTMTVRIFAKNDLNDVWHELTHLRGTPWKYYQFRYTFTNLLATDRFGGTLLITQTRRTNKLR